ncbi:MAG: hypothetical protein IPH45_07145 [Bacteroidales bacterium]|nr:hypothetical protein [Bacteroidales bacterium]
MKKSRLHIALPVLDEWNTLPLLMDALHKQTFTDYNLYICVNQPDEWWDDSAHRRVCESNRDTLYYLSSLKDPRIFLLDYSSAGSGWKGKKHGIGWARKTLMDLISGESEPEDIILSMDADTVFGCRYLETILTNFTLNPGINALSIPYYHPLTGDSKLDRAMLRYEIYMRSYAVNLWRINNPYCFTALGSAIALPVWAYRKIGGMTPKMSGEDFYFLQKLVKAGAILHWNEEKVLPAARLSERVYFGTGPALIKGMSGDWSSYPIYNMKLFMAIDETCKLFARLYESDVETPLDDFLLLRQGELPWDALRRNSRTREQFTRACHEKLDGLRILQYLKEQDSHEPLNGEKSLIELLEYLKVETKTDSEFEIPSEFSFIESSIPEINRIRNYLADAETYYRKKHWDVYPKLKK